MDAFGDRLDASISAFEKGYPEFDVNQLRDEGGRWSGGGGTRARGRGEGKKPRGGQRKLPSKADRAARLTSRRINHKPPDIGDFRPPRRARSVEGTYFSTALGMDRRIKYGPSQEKDPYDDRLTDEFIRSFVARDNMTMYEVAGGPGSTWLVLDSTTKPGSVYETTEPLIGSVSLEESLQEGSRYGIEILVPKGMNIAPVFAYNDKVSAAMEEIARSEPMLSGGVEPILPPTNRILAMPTGTRMRYNGNRTTTWPGMEHTVFQFTILPPKAPRSRKR
jgi:hypothetical protein